MTTKEIIAHFSALRYFASNKTPEKRLAMVEQFVEEFDTDLQIDLENSEEFEAKCNDISTLLTLEIQRRHDEKVKKELDKAEKAEKAASKESLKPLVAGQHDQLEHVKTLPKGRYVLSAAQNNTHVNSDFIASLELYCKRNDATLLIAPVTYRKSSYKHIAENDTANNDENETWFAPEVKPYLFADHVDLGGLHFIGNANPQITIINPLAGSAGVTPAGIDLVMPHTQIALECVASLKNAKGKRLFSTGAVTVRNYLHSRQGMVASGYHTIGAIFVDTTGDRPIVRQLEQMPNFSGFYDENVLYKPQGAFNDNKPELLQFGDVHAEKMEKANLDKAVALLQRYRPERVLIHDVMDFASRNHHNVKDCVFIFGQTVNGNTVEGDIKLVTKALDTFADNLAEGSTLEIIESNHDLAINTWLKTTDFKADPVNALTYLKCMTALYEHIEKKGNDYFNMLAFAYKKIGKGKNAAKINFHEIDESVIFAGVENGCHGHTGINGSRGNPKSFRALGIPMNTGHTHTPSIYGKVYTAGVLASLEMGYNVGASSWQIASIVTYPNGQRQVIFM